MTLKFKRVAVMAAGGLAVFVGLAGSLLWLMPPPHGRLQYMIAGTAATAAALGAVFARVVTGGRERIRRNVPRNGGIAA